MSGEEEKEVRPLILASASLEKTSDEAFPRVADWEIYQRFNAGLLQYDDLQINPHLRRIEEAIRLDFSLARRGLSLIDGHNVIFSTSEKVGIPLLALQTRRAAVPHVMLGHHLLSPLKFRFLKTTGLLRKLSLLLCLSREELRLLRLHSGLPPERVVMLEGVVTDHRFFLPAPGHGEGFVLSTGATLRDYPTLMRALGGLPIKVVIASGSQWVKGSESKGKIPSNFTFLPKQSLKQMRDLYARCAVVVIPLHRGTQHSAGRTTATEAMASAKPLVATDLPGMRDYVTPGRNGLLVEEGSEIALREAIKGMLANEKWAIALGLAGRQLTETKWNIELYVNDLCRLLRQVVQGSEAPQV
ncbi:MAG: glycosyltransferase [Armatimonadetes bacterium]|nr:glycosyltransferase [Armatimonadota bacterium]NIM23302.1 glycosyltransferase [Armatimonadota bacterium]NIM67166.1 glycosyltransferase [Armatimonadota bacterium]NIM75693.1 glycosyltransferase [Armatimonadota bacterium]NIN05355.1 glycosyltransferase [Armatimonadota bacterium]